MTAHAVALSLITPWISRTLNDPAPDPDARLQAANMLQPGRLPDDYVGVILALKQAISLERNRIMSIELPHPREEGQFTAVGPNPRFSKLYGLGGEIDDCYNVAGIWESMAEFMPKGLIPIGESTGDQICLDVSEAGNGRIYHWFHEGDPGENDAEGYRGWGNTFLLANSFTDLCARLCPPLPYEPDPDLDQARICWSRP